MQLLIEETKRMEEIRAARTALRAVEVELEGRREILASAAYEIARDGLDRQVDEVIRAWGDRSSASASVGAQRRFYRPKDPQR